MKKLVALLLFICCSLSVFSQYYGTYDVNTKENININKREDIHVSGSVYQTQTIHSIDYGALALANAEQERNRLAALQYQDEQQRQLAISIANNPLKAYDYGQIINQTVSKKEVGCIGFKKLTQRWVLPYFFFSPVGLNEFQNISEDGITTYVIMKFLYYSKSNRQEVEDYSTELKDLKVGKYMDNEMGDSIEIFDVKRQMSTIWSTQGFKVSVYWQNSGQIGVTEYYLAYTELSDDRDCIMYDCMVRYYGELGEVDWDMVEGRRYYLKSLVEKVISTAYLSDVKVIKEK